MTPTDTTLRHGLREEQFRRYELAIAEITKAWPEVTFHAPSGRVTSLETLRARLRDATLSYYKHSWPSTLIDRAKFETFFHDLIIGIDSTRGTVTAGPKRPRDAKHAVLTSRETQSASLNITTEDSEVIMALVILHHRAVLTWPTNLTTKLNPMDYIKDVDVSIVQKSEHLYTLA